MKRFFLNDIISDVYDFFIFIGMHAATSTDRNYSSLCGAEETVLGG